MLTFATDGLNYPTSAPPVSSSHPPLCESCSSMESLQPEVPVHSTTCAGGQTDPGRKAAALMKQSQRGGTKLVSPEQHKPPGTSSALHPLVPAQCAWGHPLVGQLSDGCPGERGGGSCPIQGRTGAQMCLRFKPKSFQCFEAVGPAQPSCGGEQGSFPALVGRQDGLRATGNTTFLLVAGPEVPALQPASCPRNWRQRRAAGSPPKFPH